MGCGSVRVHRDEDDAVVVVQHEELFLLDSYWLHKVAQLDPRLVQRTVSLGQVLVGGPLSRVRVLLRLLILLLLLDLRLNVEHGLLLKVT